MSVQTKPSGYGTYKCEFIAHLAQGEATPLTVRVERPRSEQTKCCLYINVGPVQVVRAELDVHEDAADLAELFTRVRLYEFPPKSDEN